VDARGSFDAGGHPKGINPAIEGCKNGVPEMLRSRTISARSFQGSNHGSNNNGNRKRKRKKDYDLAGSLDLGRVSRGLARNGLEASMRARSMRRLRRVA